MTKKIVSIILIIFCCTGCSTSRDLRSSHYLPDWENRLFTFPSPSETSGGYWAVKAARATGQGIGHLLLFPFALAANLALNAYYIITWPVRWPLRGDKRLIVWHPLFASGEKVGSRYFSKEWNEDLS